MPWITCIVSHGYCGYARLVDLIHSQSCCFYYCAIWKLILFFFVKLLISVTVCCWLFLLRSLLLPRLIFTFLLRSSILLSLTVCVFVTHCLLFIFSLYQSMLSMFILFGYCCYFVARPSNRHLIVFCFALSAYCLSILIDKQYKSQTRENNTQRDKRVMLAPKHTIKISTQNRHFDFTFCSVLFFCSPPNTHFEPHSLSVTALGALCVIVSDQNRNSRTAREKQKKKNA